MWTFDTTSFRIIWIITLIIFTHIFCVIEINIGLYEQTLCTLSQNLKENNSSHQLKECSQTKGKQKILSQYWNVLDTVLGYDSIIFSLW